MSRESAKATMQSWFTAWNDANLAAIDDLFAPDYAVNGNEVTPSGVKQAVVWLRSTFHDRCVTIEEMVAEADRVVVRWTLRGTHNGPFMGVPATGKPVTLAGINIYRLAGGRIKENHECVDVHGLLQQLGATLTLSNEPR